MKKISLLFGAMILCLSFMLAPGNVVSAATFSNGTYDVSFELKESGNNNTSIADGYFKKPAKLIVKNGSNYIQVTTTESDWVKSISGPYGAATVISESGNQRTVQFQVGDVSSPVPLKMHIVVPKDIAGMEYDHHHSVRAVFNTSGIPVASQGTGQSSGQSQSTTTTTSDNSVANPKTGDASPIALYAGLLLVSVAGLAFYRKRTAKS